MQVVYMRSSQVIQRGKSREQVDPLNVEMNMTPILGAEQKHTSFHSGTRGEDRISILSNCVHVS
jgi:hypothetical protein